MSDQDPKDRRVETRLPSQFEVDYSADGTYLFAYVTDISTMGIFIRTESPLEVGAEITLHFRPINAVTITAELDPPHSFSSAPRPHTPEILELAGVVKWNTKNREHPGQGGMGVQFRQTTPQQRSAILARVHTVAYLDDSNV